MSYFNDLLLCCLCDNVYYIYKDGNISHEKEYIYPYQYKKYCHICYTRPYILLIVTFSFIHPTVFILVRRHKQEYSSIHPTVFILVGIHPTVFILVGIHPTIFILVGRHKQEYPKRAVSAAISLENTKNGGVDFAPNPASSSSVLSQRQKLMLSLICVCF